MANIAEVLKLAAKPVQYDNDEKTHRNGRTSADHPNVESHTVRLVGDTDHWTKLETGAKSAEQKRV